jgi:hypothetical protein
MSRSFTTLLIILTVLVFAAGATAGFFLSQSPAPAPAPAPKPSTVHTTTDSAHCYIEIQVPKTPVLWLETPREGTSNESCQSIDQAAAAYVPSGSDVFLSGRPVPSVVIVREGTLTVLALPGTVSPQLQHQLQNGLGHLLPQPTKS